MGGRPRNLCLLALLLVLFANAHAFAERLQHGAAARLEEKVTAI